MPGGLLYLDKDFFVCSESHLLTGVLENYLSIVTLFTFLITIFFFLDFCLSSVNNLIFRTCQLLCFNFGYCQQKKKKKLGHSIFDSFSQNFNSTLLGNYNWLFNFFFFWLTPHAPPQTNIVTLLPYHFCQLAIIGTKIDLTILSIHQNPLSILFSQSRLSTPFTD